MVRHCARLSCLVVLFLAPSAYTSRQQEQRNAPSSPFEMQVVLERHARWLASDGTEGSRADLRQITLEGVSGGLDFILSSGVILRGADLRRGDFRQASMRGVDLAGARLEEADFRESNLRWAVFDAADLRNADFAGANLDSTLLREANLQGARFEGADLRGADLSGARCLTPGQVATAVQDEFTRLPDFEDCE